MSLRKIDVHHHMVPDFLKRELNGLGIKHAGGKELPDWDPEKSLAIMDAAGIQKSYLSTSCPGVFFGDSVAACELSRQCNEYAGELRREDERFGFFATIPQTLEQGSVSEARHALDYLGADGVTLLSSVDGIYLGNPKYDALMEELNRRKAVVFLHPNLHSTADDIDLELPGFMMEFVFDTTRAVANLIASGTMEKYPDIKFILSHAGGTVPYIAWRMSLADFVLDMEGKFPKGTLHYLKQFYYDTALSPSPYMLAALRELVGVDRLLFGSDFPFAPDMAVLGEVADFSRLDFSEEERLCVERGNAIDLLGAE